MMQLIFIWTPLQLHVCNDFVLGQCLLGNRCSLGHYLSSQHARRIFKHFSMIEDEKEYVCNIHLSNIMPITNQNPPPELISIAGKNNDIPSSMSTCNVKSSTPSDFSISSPRQSISWGIERAGSHLHEYTPAVHLTNRIRPAQSCHIPYSPDSPKPFLRVHESLRRMRIVCAKRGQVDDEELVEACPTLCFMEDPICTMEKCPYMHLNVQDTNENLWLVNYLWQHKMHRAFKESVVFDPSYYKTMARYTSTHDNWIDFPHNIQESIEKEYRSCKSAYAFKYLCVVFSIFRVRHIFIIQWQMH